LSRHLKPDIYYRPEKNIDSIITARLQHDPTIAIKFGLPCAKL